LDLAASPTDSLLSTRAHTGLIRRSYSNLDPRSHESEVQEMKRKKLPL
jgi:hypothetical protein